MSKIKQNKDGLNLTAKKVKQEKQEKQDKVGFKTYFAKHKVNIIIYLTTMMLAYLMGIFIVLYTANFVQKVSVNAFDQALIILLIYMGVSLFEKVMYWICFRIFYITGSKFAFDIKKDLTSRALKLSSKTYSRSSSGMFITRITHDTEEVVSNFDMFVESLANIIAFAFSIVYIAILNIYIALIVLVTIIISGLIEIKRTELRGKNRKVYKKASEQVTSITNEIVRSEKDIKALDLDENLQTLSSDSFINYRKAYIKYRLTDDNLWRLRNIFVTFSVFAICFISLFLLKNSALSLAAFLFIYLNRNAVNDLIWSVGMVASSLTDCKVAGSRMFELYDEKKYPVEKFGTTELTNPKGRIEFKNVYFAYEELATEEEKEVGEVKKKPRRKKKEPAQEETKEVLKNRVLEGLNFVIPENKTVAFVGRSGSGKSTILNLISKMDVVDDGEVLIDGININDLDKKSIRNNISIVNQFPYLFEKTIRQNLTLVKADATEEELLAVCEKASLLEFVKSLPKQLDTKVGEGGVKLSGGQKQRLAIARALLKNTKIILFDESTSSLDNFAQEDVKKSIDSLSENSTVVIVAHRLSTIKNSDIIFFLDKGKIIEQGTFDELNENCEDFKNLFKTENV